MKKSFFIFVAVSFKIEFYACGLTSVNRDLIILGIEDFSISVNILRFISKSLILSFCFYLGWNY
jgi:hypothetical protein